MIDGSQSGDFPPLMNGSDADVDINCTPCGEDNVREEAVKYCPECHEYLCATCTRHHGRQKATRSHKLIDHDDVKHGPMVATKCVYHSDRDIEMYCSKHDMVYCTLCIATQHRSCSGVYRIEDDQNMQDAEVQSLIDKTKNVYESLKAVTIKKQNNIDSLEEQRKAIKQNILEVEKVIIEHTRKLKNGLFESLETNYTKMKAELESEISTATTMIHDFEKTVTQLQTVTDATPRQQFVQMKITQKAVGDADQSNGTKALHFTENTELKNYVTSATALGQVMIMITGPEEPGVRDGGKGKDRGGGGGRLECKGDGGGRGSDGGVTKGRRGGGVNSRGDEARSWEGVGHGYGDEWGVVRDGGKGKVRGGGRGRLECRGDGGGWGEDGWVTKGRRGGGVNSWGDEAGSWEDVGWGVVRDGGKGKVRGGGGGRLECRGDGGGWGGDGWVTKGRHGGGVNSWGDEGGSWEDVVHGYGDEW